MTREQARKWLLEITHYANGGDLWSFKNNEWVRYENEQLVFTSDELKAYVIEDKHFEARKAFALGEPIEQQATNKGWFDNNSPDWSGDKYRPKSKEWYDNIPKEGILCWVWDENEKITVAVKIVEYVNGRVKDEDCVNWNYAKPVKPEECWKSEK